MLGFLTVITNIAILYLFFFLQGYLILHSRKNEVISISFSLRLPIYIGIGLATSIVLFSLLGLFTISRLLVLSVFLACLSIFLFIRIRNAKNLQGLLSIISSLTKPSGIVPILFFFISFLYFARVTSDMGWPPPGDPVAHGFFVSLMMHTQRIPFTLAPYTATMSLLPFWYPIGFHVLGAVTSLLLNVYPGEGVLLLSGVLSTLIPQLLYSTVYIKTKSITLSTIAFFSPYLTDKFLSWSRLAYWIMGYFYNGVYPFLLAVVLICLLFSIIILDHCSLDFHSKRYPLLLAILCVGVAIVYPPFVYGIFLYLGGHGLILVKQSFLKKDIVPKKLILLFSCSIIIAAGLVLSFLYLKTDTLVKLFRETTSILRVHQEWLVTRKVDLSVLYDNINGIVIWGATIMALISIRNKRDLSMNTFYLCFLIPALLSIFLPFVGVNLLWMIIPRRSLVLLIPLSWVVFTLHVTYFLGDTLKKGTYHLSLNAAGFKKKASIFALKNFTTRIFKYALIMLLFGPALFAHFSLLTNAIQTGNWISPNDFAALEWIHKNVSTEELILNDRSWEGLFITSFSIKNAVFIEYPFQLDPTARERAIECSSLLDNPENYTLVNYLIKKWNIKYIFIASREEYFDYWREPFEYKWRPHSPSEYIAWFDMNPSLYAVFRRENTGVYKTLIDGL